MSFNQPSASNINDKQGFSTPTPDDIERVMALALEAVECIKAYKCNEAIEKYSQALALYPDPCLFCSRAGIYSTLEQYDDAINDCRRALEIDPKCADAYYPLGSAFYGLKHYDEAIEAYKKALELNPSDEESRRDLAFVEENLKAKEMSTPTPEDIKEANALKEEGNECMQAYKFNDAIEKYSQALKLNRDPAYLTNRAAAFCHLKKYIDAGNDCDSAIFLDDKYTKAYGRMGFIASCQGHYMYSVKYYKKALRLNPNNDNYKENLALAEAKLRDVNYQS